MGDITSNIFLSLSLATAVRLWTRAHLRGRIRNAFGRELPPLFGLLSSQVAQIQLVESDRIHPKLETTYLV